MLNSGNGHIEILFPQTVKTKHDCFQKKRDIVEFDVLSSYISHNIVQQPKPQGPLNRGTSRKGGEKNMRDGNEIASMAKKKKNYRCITQKYNYGNEFLGLDHIVLGKDLPQQRDVFVHRLGPMHKKSIL